MLETPWVPVLTVVFLLTGIVCVGDLVARRRRAVEEQPLSDDELIDVNHGVMSAAMILMLWVMVDGVFAWAQVAIFAILAASLVPAYLRTKETTDRIDLIGHGAMDVAMIWMLAAMPVLMSELAGTGAGSGHHGGGDSGGVPAPTPMWADAVNVFFVAASAAAALWWIYRTVTANDHRLHRLSYAVMAAGMGVMLLIMNT